MSTQTATPRNSKPLAQSRVHLRAEARQVFKGRLLLRGDPFTATEREAQDLCALRFASRVVHPSPSAQRAEGAQGAGSAALPDAPEVQHSEGSTAQRRTLASKPHPRGRHYARKDMVAEQD